MKKVFVLAVVVLAMAVSAVYAQQDTSVPPLINYQGRLTDAEGKGLAGTRKIEFNIYDAATGGTKIWGPQVFNSVPLINGMFNVIIGSTDTEGRLITDAFSAKERYIGVTVEGKAILPRQQVLSAPFAVKAENAYNAAKADIAATLQNTKAQLDSNGNFIRKIARATGLRPIDDTDSGQIKSRILKLNKIKNDTAIRIGYSDNFHVLGQKTACRWEIRIDGVSCSGGLVYDYYSGDYEEVQSGTVSGYCEDISAGEHEIQIWVGKVPSYNQGNCGTGWNDSRWTIEAEEVY